MNDMNEKRKKPPMWLGIIIPHLTYPMVRILLGILSYPLFRFLANYWPSNIANIRETSLIIIAFLAGILAIKLYPKYKTPIILTNKQITVVIITYLLMIPVWEMTLLA